MRLTDDRIREALAAEFVLGTMTARVRRRFESWLRYDGRLRASVDAWERQLDPLTVGLPEREPPARVWTAIATRIGSEGSRVGTNAQASVPFWRGLALALALVLAVGIVYLSTTTRDERRADMMAVLNDEKSEAALLVSWPLQQAQKKFVKVRLVAANLVPPEGSWELWLIPSDRMDRPISAGIVSMSPDQTLEVSAPAAAALTKAWGFAVSIEPKGGSPTGAPTGPVIFRGPCIKLINT